MSVGPYSEKLNIIITTMDARKSTFFCLRLEISFLGKFGPKIKIVSLSWNLVPRLIPIGNWIQWSFYFFHFQPEIPFSGKFVPNIPNCLFRLKLASITFIIFWDFLISYQVFLSPQVKQWAIITCEYVIYELPYELANDLRLRILGNEEILGKCLNPIEW